MRENIGLCRGKRCDNDEWVEGYLVKFGKESFYDNDRYGIMEDTTLIAKVVTDNKGSSLIMRECDYVYHNVKVTEVIPETVGEFTGLTDKNGKKIWEGDIVKVDERIFNVVWDEKKALFHLENRIVREFADFYYYFGYELEVISNIHDNSELLK